MTNASSNSLDPEGNRANQRRPFRVLLGLCVLVGVALAGWFMWRAAGAIEPPTADLSNAEPELVAVIADARSAVKHSPRSANAWGHLGMLLLAHAFLPESEECFSRLRELDPGNGRWAYLRALITFQTRPEETVSALEEAAELCGAVAAPRLKFAETLAEHGRLTDAETNFRAVLEYDPDNPRAELGLGRVAYARGDWQESLQQLSKSVERAPKVRATHVLLAELHQRLGNPAAAAHELQLAAEGSDDLVWPDPFMDPVDRLKIGVQVRLDAAKGLLQQGRGKEAADMMQETVRLHPESYAAHVGYGRLLLKTGNAAPAEIEFREAVRLRPESLLGQLDLAAALERAQNYPEAVECCRAALRIKPQYGPAQYRLGVCLQKLGQKAEAIEALRTAAKCQPDFLPAHRELAELLMNEGAFAEAASHLEDALQLSPTDQSARQLLAQVRERSGQRNR